MCNFKNKSNKEKKVNKKIMLTQVRNNVEDEVGERTRQKN